MSENKRYYWLKLQETFFEDDTIDFIESQENGERYVLFYLKLCLKALKNEGKLIRYVGELLMPYDEAGIAKLTRTNIDTVRSALILFANIGLIKRLETGEIYLTQLNELIGSETDAAKRKRKQRINENALANHTPLQIECDPKEENVTKKCENVTPVSQKGHTDIDIEKDKELDKDLDKDLNSKSHCRKTTKGDDSYPQEFYNTIYKCYFDNFSELFPDKEKPILNYKSIKGRIKDSFDIYGFGKVLEAVKDSKNHSWLVNNGGYDIAALFSANEISRLVNKTYRAEKTSPSKSYKEKETHVDLSERYDMASFLRGETA